MNPDAPPPRSPVLLLGDDWDVQPKRPRVVVIAAVTLVVLIVTGFGLLRSRERMSDSENAREWKPISLLPAALSRDPEFHGAPAQSDPLVGSPFPEGRGDQGVRIPPAEPAPAARTARTTRGGHGVRTSPGYVSINSRPWAELSIDGVVLGNTPQIKIRVTPGRHHLSLAREGFQTHNAWVVVPAGGTVRLTDITLTHETR
jgi:PEGA domain